MRIARLRSAPARGVVHRPRELPPVPHHHPSRPVGGLPVGSGNPVHPVEHLVFHAGDDVISGVARLRGRSDRVRPHRHRHRRQRLRLEPRRGLPADHAATYASNGSTATVEQLPFPSEEADPSGHLPAPDAQVRSPRHVEGVAEEPRPVPSDPFPDRGQSDATRRFGGQPPVDAPRADRLPFEHDSRCPSREEDTDERGPPPPPRVSPRRRRVGRDTRTRRRGGDTGARAPAEAPPRSRRGRGSPP